MSERSEAQGPEQEAGRHPEALGPHVDSQGRVYPAQRLPQVRHELDVRIPALLKAHSKRVLDALDERLPSLAILHIPALCHVWAHRRRVGQDTAVQSSEQKAAGQSEALCAHIRSWEMCIH